MRPLQRVTFKNVKESRCRHLHTKTRISHRYCQTVKKLYRNKKALIEAQKYVATQHIPLMPRKHTKQIVLGTSTYLLPYLVLNEYFILFALPQKDWTFEKNMLLIECIANQYIDSSIIRIVTTPSDLVDEKKNYRITAEEICILKKYKFNFYKYISPIHNNIYFCSKLPIKNCALVYANKKDIMCEGKLLTNKLFI